MTGAAMETVTRSEDATAPDREPLLEFMASALCGGRNVRRILAGISPWRALRRARRFRSRRPACSLSSMPCAPASRSPAAGVPEDENWDESGDEEVGGLESLATPRKLRPYLRRGRGLFFLLSSLFDNATDMVLMATTLAVVLAAVKTQVALSLHGELQWSCPPVLVTNYSCARTLHTGSSIVAQLKGEVLGSCSYALARSAVRLRYAPFLSPAGAALGTSAVFGGGKTQPTGAAFNALFAAVNGGNGTGSRCTLARASAKAIPAACPSESVRLRLGSPPLHPSLTMGSTSAVGMESLTAPLFQNDWGSDYPCPYAPGFAGPPAPAPPSIDAAVTFTAASAPTIVFETGPRKGQEWSCHPLIDATRSTAFGPDSVHYGCSAAPVRPNGTALCGKGTVPDYVRVCGPGPDNASAPSTFAADTGHAGTMHASLLSRLKTVPNRTAPYTHLCAPQPVFQAASSGSDLAKDLRYSAGVCTALRALLYGQGRWVLALAKAVAWPITVAVGAVLVIFNLPLLGASSIYCAPSLIVNALFMMILFMAGQELLGLVLVAAALCTRRHRSRMAITVFAKRSIAAAAYLAIAYARTPRAWERLDRRVLLERRAQLRAFRGGRFGLQRNPKVPESHWPPLLVRLLLLCHLVAELGQIMFSAAIALTSLLALGPESETRGTAHRAFAGLSLLLSAVSIGRTAADWWTSLHHRHCLFGCFCGCYTLWRCCCVRGPPGCALCLARRLRAKRRSRTQRAAEAGPGGDPKAALLDHSQAEEEEAEEEEAEEEEEEEETASK